MKWNISFILGIIFSVSAGFAGENSALNGTWNINGIYCVSGAEPLVRMEEMRDITFSFQDGKEIVINHLRGGCVATDTADYTIKGNRVFFKNKVVSYGSGCGSNAGKTDTWHAVTNTFSVSGNNLLLRAHSIGNFAICPDGDTEVTDLSPASK